MTAGLSYLWEGSICLLLLYTLYRFFLARLTFFSWNRAYLMLTLVLVLTIPRLAIPVGPSPDTPAAGGLLYLVPEFEIPPSEENPSATVPLLLHVLFWVYMTGLAVSLLRLFTGLYQIFRQIRSSERHIFQGTPLLIHPDFTPSSFLKYIFLPEYLPGNKDQLMIIAHEQIHSKFYHSFDCLTFQLFRCIFWFHPIIKLMENSLYEVHEYQVDREITKSHSKAEYSRLLVHLIRTGGGKLVNSFNQFQIRNRIMMMAKENSKLREKFKFLLILPLMGLLIALFSCEPQEELSPAPPPPPMESIAPPPPPMEVFDLVENMPVPSGGMEKWSQYLADNLVYTKEAKEKGVTGTVYLTFIVDTEGSVQHVEILRGIGCGLDEEALRVIKNSPNWMPGTQTGQKVNVRMRIPIRFGSQNPKASQKALEDVAGQEVNPQQGELKVNARYADGVWSGTVRDPGGRVVPGATITEAETDLGTVTDTKGRFSIKTAMPSAILQVNFPGYESTSVK